MPQPKPTAFSPQQDPANSEPSPAADEDPVLPDSKVKQSAQSTDPPQIPPIDADPAAKISADPPLQDAPPTTIQLSPQPNESSTTLFIGGKTDGEESSSGLGALIYNTFGRLDPTAKETTPPIPKLQMQTPSPLFQQ